MEQVANIINPMTSTVFWSVIVFAIMVVVLWRVALRPVNNIMVRRKKETENKVMVAQKQKEEAQKILDQQKKALEAAWEKTRRMIEEAKQEAETIRGQIIEDAHKKSRQLVENARLEAAREKEKTLKEVRDRIADISVDIAQKMLSKHISLQEHQRLIEESLKEMEEV